MNNPILISEKKSESLVSTKELAEMLGVDVKTIQRMTEKLFDNNVQKVSNGGRPSMMFNEQQATLIKIELQNHSKLARNGFNTVSISNDLEMMLMQQKLSEYQNMRIQQLTSELNNANAQLIEQKPKADVYDKICNSESLKPVDQVASNLGYGKNNFFALMRGMGIFYYSSKDAEGKKVNLPKQEYKDRGYFVTKEEPYSRGDKDCLYTKIYVTGKGEIWLTKKLTEETAESFIERGETEYQKIIEETAEKIVKPKEYTIEQVAMLSGETVETIRMFCKLKGMLTDNGEPSVYGISNGWMLENGHYTEEGKRKVTRAYYTIHRNEKKSKTTSIGKAE